MKRGPVLTAVLLLAGLALFAILFSIAAENDRWPRLPAGALHNTDLWAGLAAGATFLLLLLRGGRRGRRGRGDAETRGGRDAAAAGRGDGGIGGEA